MSRTVITAGVVGILVLLAVSVVAGCGAGTKTGEAFVDNWKEPGAHPAYVMRIDSAHDGVFDVTYRRFYPAGGEFRFGDGKLTYSPVSSDQTDVITYDADSDTITITGAGSGRSFTLSRARP
jgi:hypothetical protein